MRVYLGGWRKLPAVAVDCRRLLAEVRWDVATPDEFAREVVFHLLKAEYFKRIELVKRDQEGFPLYNFKSSQQMSSLVTMPELLKYMRSNKLKKRRK